MTVRPVSTLINMELSLIMRMTPGMFSVLNSKLDNLKQDLKCLLTIHVYHVKKKIMGNCLTPLEGNTVAVADRVLDCRGCVLLHHNAISPPITWRRNRLPAAELLHQSQEEPPGLFYC